jgi:hypothetical protein
MFGKSVKPPQPSGIWKAVTLPSSFPKTYTADVGDKTYRRSVYTFWKRGMPPPQMSLLNAPSRESCTARRERTNTPLQALVLRHELGFVESARGFAERLMSSDATFKEQLERAWLMLLARRPEAAEVAVMMDLRAERLEYFREHPEVCDTLVSLGQQPVNKALDKVELAALTEVCRVLFNLDETLTRN